MKLPLSAFIICQDEERFIEPCIRSLGMCSEIVVVDSGSTDRTLEILAALKDEGFPLLILSEKWRGYGGQKQFAMERCTEPWCLSIDSDERVSPHLAAELPRLLAEPDVAGWRVTRYPYLDGFGYAPPQAKERYNLRILRNVGVDRRRRGRAPCNLHRDQRKAIVVAHEHAFNVIDPRDS